MTVSEKPGRRFVPKQYSDTPGQEKLPGGRPVRGARIRQDIWAAALHRARYEDHVTLAYALVCLLTEWADGTITLPDAALERDQSWPAQSIRIADALWTRVQQRAWDEGLTPSEVLAKVTIGYAGRVLDLSDA